jgi:RNA polymerase sigma-70 factor (ECF subfamily)
MLPPVPEPISKTIETLYRSESGRVLATLVRLLGDLDLAEESMHEAFAAALESWPQTGIPDKPRPWLISTARFKAIDGMRRRARFDGAQRDLIAHMESRVNDDLSEDEEIEDDRLRLIFTCCHPALPPEGQVALTLREICGITTEEIARAFLVTPATLAQRIVRSKVKIREASIPYEVPEPQELPERLDSVLQVIYLVFNEGYSAAAGTEVTRAELTGEAIRLGRMLTELQPEPEVLGLLALMLLQESRRTARTSPSRELILLADQDRMLWNREQIEEGVALVEKAGPEFPPLRALHTTGCDCGRSRRGGDSRCNRLATDCRALQPLGADSAFAGCISQSRRGDCRMRWSRGRPDADRCIVGAWRISELPPGAFSPCRVVPSAGQNR